MKGKHFKELKHVMSLPKLKVPDHVPAIHNSRGSIEPKIFIFPVVHVVLHIQSFISSEKKFPEH